MPKGKGSSGRKEITSKDIKMGIADPGFGRIARPGRAVAGQVGKALSDFAKRTGSAPSRPAPTGVARTNRPQTKSAPAKAPAAPKKTSSRPLKYDEKRKMWL